MARLPDFEFPFPGASCNLARQLALSIVAPRHRR